MKLIKSLVAVFALLSMATPSYAQGVLGQLENLIMPGSSQGNRRGALPPTNLDSFVWQAGGAADQIYGDEGDVNIPPIDSFQKQNRINAGIFGQRSAGLTTGHGSFMPDAWGADEFLGNEWDMSGSSYNPNRSIDATQLNAAQAAAGLLARSALNNSISNSNNTSSVDVNGTIPITPATIIPAFISAFGAWATADVPYAVTEGMKPVQDSVNGQLMGWMAPGDSLSAFLSGQTGRLLPSEAAAAQSMLQNLPAGSDITVPTP